MDWLDIVSPVGQAVSTAANTAPTTGALPATPPSPQAQQFFNTQDWMNMPKIPREAGAPGYKGLGYFGAIPRPDGQYSTELAADDKINGKRLDFPLMVPTLSKPELDSLLSGARPTDEIYRKAIAHAIARGQGGKDPFATQFDQRVP